LVLDTASALKHGELTRKKPRLIRRADKVATQPGAFSGGFNPAFNVGAVQPSPRRCKSKPPPTTPRMHW
jgi:uncharacterized protein (DUF2344 family)